MADSMVHSSDARARGAAFLPKPFLVKKSCAAGGCDRSLGLPLREPRPPCETLPNAAGKARQIGTPSVKKRTDKRASPVPERSPEPRPLVVGSPCRTARPRRLPHAACCLLNSKSVVYPPCVGSIPFGLETSI